MGTPVVLDCSSSLGAQGIGGGLALLCLLGSRSASLLGVTTTFGPEPVDQVYRGIKSLLRLLGREEIPLLHGAPWPGYRSTEAAHFLARAARERPGQLTIIASGPLANLRAAAEVSRGFFGDVGRIVCAGGYRKPAGLGWGMPRERCLTLDPESAGAVLGSHRPVTVLPADLCLQGLFGRKDLAASRAWPSWARLPVRRALLLAPFRSGRLRLPVWELLPVAYVLRPQHFEDRMRYCVSDLAALARGELDLADRAAGVAINVPVRLRDPALLRRELVSGIGGAFRASMP